MTTKTPEQLVSVYGDMVYRLAYAQTRSRHDADDIVQEVFLQTVRKAGFRQRGARKGMAAAGDAQLPEKPLAHGMAAARHTAR